MDARCLPDDMVAAIASWLSAPRDVAAMRQVSRTHARGVRWSDWFAKHVPHPSFARFVQHAMSLPHRDLDVVFPGWREYGREFSYYSDCSVDDHYFIDKNALCAVNVESLVSFYLMCDQATATTARCRPFRAARFLHVLYVSVYQDETNQHRWAERYFEASDAASILQHNILSALPKYFPRNCTVGHVQFLRPYVRAELNRVLGLYERNQSVHFVQHGSSIEDRLCKLLSFFLCCGTEEDVRPIEQLLGYVASDDRFDNDGFDEDMSTIFQFASYCPRRASDAILGAMLRNPMCCTRFCEGYPGVKLVAKYLRQYPEQIPTLHLEGGHRPFMPLYYAAWPKYRLLRNAVQQNGSDIKGGMIESSTRMSYDKLEPKWQRIVCTPEFWQYIFGLIMEGHLDMSSEQNACQLYATLPLGAQIACKQNVIEFLSSLLQYEDILGHRLWNIYFTGLNMLSADSRWAEHRERADIVAYMIAQVTEAMSNNREDFVITSNSLTYIFALVRHCCHGDGNDAINAIVMLCQQERCMPYHSIVFDVPYSIDYHYYHSWWRLQVLLQGSLDVQSEYTLWQSVPVPVGWKRSFLLYVCRMCTKDGDDVRAPEAWMHAAFERVASLHVPTLTENQMMALNGIMRYRSGDSNGRVILALLFRYAPQAVDVSQLDMQYSIDWQEMQGRPLSEVLAWYASTIDAPEQIHGQTYNYVQKYEIRRDIAMIIDRFLSRNNATCSLVPALMARIAADCAKFIGISFSTLSYRSEDVYVAADVIEALASLTRFLPNDNNEVGSKAHTILLICVVATKTVLSRVKKHTTRNPGYDAETLIRLLDYAFYSNELRAVLLAQDNAVNAAPPKTKQLHNASYATLASTYVNIVRQHPTCFDAPSTR